MAVNTTLAVNMVQTSTPCVLVMEVRVRVRVEVPSHRWLFWAHCRATAAAKLHPAHPDSPATAMSGDTSPCRGSSPGLRSPGWRGAGVGGLACRTGQVWDNVVWGLFYFSPGNSGKSPIVLFRYSLLFMR